MTMKTTPISGDLLVKIGLGLLALGGAAMLIYTIKSQASNALGVVANAVNPASPDNVVYHTINTSFGDSEGAGANADGSWSLGGWLFDKLNPDTAAAVANVTKPIYVQPPPSFDPNGIQMGN